MRILLCLLLLFVSVPPSLAEEVYSCPMHPHITGEAGDTCSICGMKLVPTDESHPMSMPDAGNGKDDKAEVYVCPMHPHIQGKEGDNCPICGMKLVPKSDDGAATMPPGEASGETAKAVHIDPTFVQALGVRSQPVTVHEFGKTLRAYGEVVPSTRAEHSLTMRVEGWIVHLATDAVGDEVRKGDLIFTLYSRELMTKQSDYLLGERYGNVTSNPEHRLRLFGMSDKAIAKFKAGGKMMDETPFYAPMTGTITALNVRKGAYVKAGDLALTIQDFGKVWVNADVPIKDLPFLQQGQQARITVPDTGQAFKSTIDFIHPVADRNTRTGIVRLVVEPGNGGLKPGSFTDVAFQTDVKTQLAVPAEAVLRGAGGAYVFEDLGEGRFKPLAVETGVTSKGFTEVLSGVKEGQRIVTSGQFMIDAESHLRGGMAQMGAADAEAGHAH